VPLTKLQSHVLRLLAAGRSPDSYIAGGVAINRDGPRFSADIDIFQDSEDRLETAAEADAKALRAAGLSLSWEKIQSGKRQAEMHGLGETMQLEWVADSAFRFFPAQRDDHPRKHSSPGRGNLCGRGALSRAVAGGNAGRHNTPQPVHGGGVSRLGDRAAP
jgi:hypothetical protein